MDNASDKLVGAEQPSASKNYCLIQHVVQIDSFIGASQHLHARNSLDAVAQNNAGDKLVGAEQPSASKNECLM